MSTRDKKLKRLEMINQGKIVDYIIDELCQNELISNDPASPLIIHQRDVVLKIAKSLDKHYFYIQKCLTVSKSKYRMVDCYAFYNGRPKNVRHVSADTGRINKRLYRENCKTLNMLARDYL